MPPARRARGTNAHLEDAEIGNADLAALLQDATDVGDEAGEYGDRLLFGYAMIVSCPLGQMLLGDNRRLWAGHRRMLGRRSRDLWLVGRPSAWCLACGRRCRRSRG